MYPLIATPSRIRPHTAGGTTEQMIRASDRGLGHLPAFRSQAQYAHEAGSSQCLHCKLVARGTFRVALARL